jgi:predicted dehydrogenase
MAKQGGRIGIVDVNVDNFHSNVYLAALRNELKGRGFTVAGCVGMQEEPSRAWAEKNGVPYFRSAAELNRQVDHFLVLAPGNPEVHLTLCRKVFPFGKTTFVDKPFAPSLATARRIFALADKFKVAVQTSSALRYTNFQEYVREVGPANVRHIVSWGSGTSFDEYAIHPVEIAVSCLGPKAVSLMRRGTENYVQLLINFSEGRTAVVNEQLMGDTPYSAAISTDKLSTFMPVDGPSLFVNATAAILDFFESDKPTIDRAETLMVMRILDVARMRSALKGFVRL